MYISTADTLDELPEFMAAWRLPPRLSSPSEGCFWDCVQATLPPPSKCKIVISQIVISETLLRRMWCFVALEQANRHPAIWTGPTHYHCQCSLGFTPTSSASQVPI